MKKSLMWIVGLGVGGYLLYRFTRPAAAAGSGTLPTTPGVQASVPPGYIAPTSLLPGANNDPVGGAVEDTTPIQCTQFVSAPNCPGGVRAVTCTRSRPYASNCGNGPFTMEAAQSIVEQYNDEMAQMKFDETPMPTASVPQPAGNGGYYGTTNTGCKGFYSLPDRSKCTKQPKAQKCQGTKIFDFCHAGWKTPQAAENIIKKMLAAAPKIPA